MPKVKVGDINMYYETHGKGEPLVMIAGISASMDFWFKIIPVFSKEYRLVVFDNRGSGQSDAPDVPYTIEMMADDLAGLLDAIGIYSAHILGHSMGGRIAQEFALRYPSRLKSLILAATAFGGPHELKRSDSQEFSSKFEHILSLPLKESMVELNRLMFSQEFIDKESDFIKEFIANMMKHPAPPQGIMRQGQRAVHSTYERLPEISAPTLVISGDSDMFGPAAENSRILASRIPGAELVILRNMGHGFMFEAFDEFNRIIMDFLKRHSKSGKPK